MRKPSLFYFRDDEREAVGRLIDSIPDLVGAGVIGSRTRKISNADIDLMLFFSEEPTQQDLITLEAKCFMEQLRHGIKLHLMIVSIRALGMRIRRGDIVLLGALTEYMPIFGCFPDVEAISLPKETRPWTGSSSFIFDIIEYIETSIENMQSHGCSLQTAVKTSYAILQLAVLRLGYFPRLPKNGLRGQLRRLLQSKGKRAEVLDAFLEGIPNTHRCAAQSENGWESASAPLSVLDRLRDMYEWAMGM